jgi:hypothetical protein
MIAGSLSSCIAGFHQSCRFSQSSDHVVIQIEGSSYRLRQHGDLVPEHLRAKALVTPPPAPKCRGRPPGKKAKDPEDG